MAKISLEVPAPHLQRSGSHSLTARKQGQCFVLQDERHRQPGNLLGPVYAHVHVHTKNTQNTKILMYDTARKIVSGNIGRFGKCSFNKNHQIIPRKSFPI